MKKTIITAVVTALAVLVSCTKEEYCVTTAGESPVFTAIIGGATKNTVNPFNGKVSWELTDEISVWSRNSGESVKYEIKSIDPETGAATFVAKSGQPVLGKGPYMAIYGDKPSEEQTYNNTAGKLYMMTETLDNNLVFTVHCGLMRINLNKTGESVKRIAVTGIQTDGTRATYTLKCTESQSIDSAKDFFITLPAGNYTKIEITNNNGKECRLYSVPGVKIENNHIIPVTIEGSKLNFITAGLLYGTFTVDENNKKVRFTKGNLWADDVDSPALHFEDSQWKSTPSSSGGMSVKHVSHFMWYSTLSIAVSPEFPPSEDEFFFFCNEDHKQSVENSGNIFYVLSKKEWEYLFSTHANRLTTVYGVRGYVIAPDGFAGTLAESYADENELAKDNLLFLPAAGGRGNTGVGGVNYYGSYWMSSYSEGLPEYLYFGEQSTDYGFDKGYRNDGKSVRLVTDWTQDQ